MEFANNVLQIVKCVILIKLVLYVLKVMVLMLQEIKNVNRVNFLVNNVIKKTQVYAYFVNQLSM